MATHFVSAILVAGVLSLRVAFAQGTAETPVNPVAWENLCFELPAHQYAAEVVAQADGKFLVVAQPPTPEEGQFLRRHLPDGQTDETFAPFWAPTIDTRADPIQLRDGGYAVMTRTADDQTATLIRLNPNGAIDPDFQPSHWGSTIYEMKAGPEGCIYVRAVIPNQPLTRVESTGRIDTLFNFADPKRINYFDIADDGAVYGRTQLSDGSDDRFARLNRDGSFDPTFVPPFIPWPQVPSIRVFDNKVYVTEASVDTDWRILRLHHNGTLDEAFAPLPVGLNSLPLPFFDEAGRIYAFEAMEHFERRNKYLRRYDSNGVEDPSFVPMLFGSVGEVFAIHHGYLFSRSLGFACHPGLSQVPGRPAPVLVRRASLAPATPRVAVMGIDYGGNDYAYVTDRASRFEFRGAPELELIRTGANDQPWTVLLQTRSGTATANVDYSAQAREVHFPAGKTTAPIPFAILNDTIVERAETYYFDFFDQNSQPVGTVAVTIQNDDYGPAFSFPTVLQDGRHRIQISEPTLLDAKPVWSSTDLIQWSEYPTLLIDSVRYIEVDPTQTRYYATEAQAEGFNDIP